MINVINRFQTKEGSFQPNMLDSLIEELLAS